MKHLISEQLIINMNKAIKLKFYGCIFVFEKIENM